MNDYKPRLNVNDIFTSLLTIAFIVLKLLGVIDWSWWWVLSPIWISTLIGLLATIVILIWAEVKYGSD